MPGAERCEAVATTIAQEHTDRQRRHRVITTRRLPRAPCISHPKGLFDLRGMSLWPSCPLS